MHNCSCLWSGYWICRFTMGVYLCNLRIEGSIQEMFEGVLQFIRKNIRTKTIINPC